MSWGKYTSRRVGAIAPLLMAVIAAFLPVPPGPVQPAASISAATGPAQVPTTAPGARTGRGLDEMGDVVMSGPSALVGGEALTAVGQLLAEDASCTAAVVASSSGRLAVTAAHCVYVPEPTERMPDVADGREPGWVDELVFLPARSGGDTPHGVWEVERMWVDRAWQNDAAPEVDVAFLELRDEPTGTAQEVLGALGVRFDADDDDLVPDGNRAEVAGAADDAGPTVDVLGYPSTTRFDGTRLRSCNQAATDTTYTGVLQARCGLTRGASGGPWVVPDRGWWSAVAVTSYSSREQPGTLGGSRLGPLAQRLWRAADEAAQR